MDNYIPGKSGISKNHWYYYERSRYARISPVFNRNGRYYDRFTGLAWEEYNGRAYLEPGASRFRYRLKIESHTRLTEDVRNAIKTLIVNRICPKSLKVLYYFDCEVRKLHDTYWDARLWREKVLKKTKTKNVHKTTL